MINSFEKPVKTDMGALPEPKGQKDLKPSDMKKTEKSYSNLPEEVDELNEDASKDGNMGGD